jgi:glycosyltransferase involved in cell wall biosynthesis
MDVVTIIINYQTPDLLEQAAESFLKHNPGRKLILFDNGSDDDSSDVIKKMAASHPEEIETHFEPENIYHGPAIDKAIRDLTDAEYCFILDSDTITQKYGFLESMTAVLDSDPMHYAIGHLERMNKRGFKDPDGVPVILTPYLMLKREIYLKYHPFIHHGQPTLKNFHEAQKSGYKLIHFPVYDYIDHLWRGTASRYGYKLGLRGKWDYLLNRLGL